MNRILPLLALPLLSASGFAEPAPKAPEKPSYVTAEQVKLLWYRRLPMPTKLDKDFAKQMKAREDFVKDAKAGKYDLTAQQAASNYNKGLAVKAGDLEMAKLCEQELQRVTKALAEGKRLAQQEKANSERNDYALILMTQLQRINSSLNSP